MMRISILKFCLLLIIFNLSSNHSFGSPSLFRGVTKADGLSDLLVNVIYQDSTGFIWLGTGKGLDRFDGVRIKHFPFENALQEQRIRVNAICETKDGQMWVGNALGLWRLDEKEGFLTRVASEKISHPVNALLYAGDGQLYIGTEKGLYRYGDSRIEQISITDRTFSFSNNIRGLTIDELGKIWIVTVGSVIGYDTVRNELKEYAFSENAADQVSFRNVAFLKNRLYIGTYNKGIVCFDTSTYRFSGFVDVGSDIISSVSTDGEDMVYVATDGNGIFFISHERGEIVQSFRHDVNDPESIRSNSVYALLVDGMKRIWVGFYQDGFDYSLYQSGLFKTYELPSRFSSLNLTVRSFLMNGREKLIGTRDGLYWINEEVHTVKYFDRSVLQSDLILSLAFYQNEYYIGTYGAGIYILNPKNHSIRRFSESKEGNILSKGHIFCFRPDKEGNLWMGSSEGLIRYDAKNHKVVHFSSLNSPLPDGNVYEIFFDSEGKGWVCTDRGMALIDPVTEIIRTDLFPAGFFQKEKIHVMYEDSRQQLYFLPEKGDFYVSDIGMRSFSKMKKIPTMQANIYTAVVEDEQGGIWLSSDGGLVRIMNDEYAVFNYLHGIPSPIFTHYTAYKDGNGVLWFGNAKGLVYVDPTEVDLIDERSSSLVLSDMTVNGSSLTLKDLKNVVKEGRIQLNSGQNNLVFRFSDFSYSDPSAILVEYKMDDIDDEWRFVTGLNEISYFNLSPGKYVFRMRLAGDEDGEVMLRIKVEKSMFMVPALVMLLLVVVLLSLFVFKRKKKTIRVDENENRAVLDFPRKEDEKYKMNRLTKEECEMLYEKLNHYMQNEKPYMNKGLKIADLADVLHTSSHSLSYLFNQYLNISYYDFVNEWRITEFKKRVEDDTSSKYTLSALADLCGFSSRASFFRSFKKSTGITPNEYIKNVRNENS